MKIVTLGKLNLFLRHMKQSFTAPFAKADEDGNNIKATYLRKDEFSNAKTADEAKKLSSAHNIGGIPFDGTQDISLPGVSEAGIQDTSGNAATATKLRTARKINGVLFDGTQDIKIQAVDASEKGAANGIATLDDTGKVPSSQLPSYVDDVLEYADKASLPETGEAGKIYVTLDDEDIYRWSGSAYVRVNSAVSTAESATKLQTGRKINGVVFDGTQDIELPDDNVKKILIGGEEQAADKEKAVKLSEISDDELSLMLDGIKLKGAKCKMSDVYPATYRTMTEPENYLDTSEVTKMDGMFAGCAALESIPWGIDMRSCKSYTGMFSGCSKLSGVKLKNVPKDFNASDADLQDGQYTVITHRESGAWLADEEGNKSSTSKMMDYLQNQYVPKTATKLETPRKIALKGDVVGEASFDGSDNATISTVMKKAVSGISSDGGIVTLSMTDGSTATLQLVADNAGAHNAVYRGKDLTAYFNSGEMSKAIANGSFRDIFIGDYIDKAVTSPISNSTVNMRWRVAHLDYYYYKGAPNLTTHHVVLISETIIDDKIRMNSSDSTAGGYVASEMWKMTIPKYVFAIQKAFGISHVLSHKERLTSSVLESGPSAGGAGVTGTTTGVTWCDVLVNIPNEVQIYGTNIFGSSGYDIGESNLQFNLMMLNPGSQCARYNSYDFQYSLRSIFSSKAYCVVANNGTALTQFGTSNAGGVRPYFLLY